MQKKTKIFLVISIITIITIISVTLYYLHQKILTKNLNNSEWIENNVAILKDESLGKNIYKVYKNKNISIYNLKYQKIITKKIKELTKNISEDYLVVYNPYGTNTLSFNIYFKDSSSYSSLNYEIATSNSKNYTNTLLKKENSNAYQVIGLIPGVNNKINFTISNENKKSLKYSFSIDMSDIEIIGEKKLKVENGKSTQELSNGLYAMLGNDSDAKDYLALYDENGMIRSELPIIGYRAHAILFKDDKMYFSISQTRIAEMNNLGEITNIYRTGKYQLHHDYTFDSDGNLLVLANNTKKDTEEDCLIKINLKTQEVTEVIDFENIFKDYVKTCQLDTKSQRDEGEDGIDWLHLNSIEYVNDNLFLSSRETSSILKISNVSSNPQLEYILSNKDFWQDTDFSDYVFDQIGDFKIHAGQHSVRYLASDNPDEFYLRFFDNNYGVSNSQPSFNYNDIGITNNNPFQGDTSYYYEYKVNEKERTFELTDSFKVPYSGIVSSVQTMPNGNILVDSGTAGIFSEYDSQHNLIRKYTAKLNKYMLYRVYKYDFYNFWFEEK